MNQDYDDRQRMREHISFFCSEELKRRLTEFSKNKKKNLSSTIRRLIRTGFRMEEMKNEQR